MNCWCELSCVCVASTCSSLRCYVIAHLMYCNTTDLYVVSSLGFLCVAFKNITQHRHNVNMSHNNFHDCCIFYASVLTYPSAKQHPGTTLPNGCKRLKILISRKFTPKWQQSLQKSDLYYCEIALQSLSFWRLMGVGDPRRLKFHSFWHVWVRITLL